MEIGAPKIDSRAAQEIAKKVVELLNARSWPEADPKGKVFDPEKGASGALINIFARFAELIIERLNQVPEKNLLAFLDMLGASLLPPRPAHAPLTFSLVEGATVDAVVPAGTQVAATAVAGEKDPVIFETERELVVTTARLTAAFARQPQTGQYADYRLILPHSDENRDAVFSPTEEKSVSVFEGNKNIEHILYIAHDYIFSHPGRTKLELTFAPSGQDNLEVIWEASDGGKWREVPGAPKTITKGGTLAFDEFTPQPVAVEGIQKRWLRCSLKYPVVPNRQPPDVNGIKLKATFEKRGMVEKAFTNGFPVDTSRTFFPFGETPRAGDTFYLNVDEAFAEVNCKMTLAVESSLVPSVPLPGNTADYLYIGLPSPFSSIQFDIADKGAGYTLVFEYYKAGTPPAAGAPPASVWQALSTDRNTLEDRTSGWSTQGAVTFTPPADWNKSVIDGKDMYWVRISTSQAPSAPATASRVTVMVANASSPARCAVLLGSSTVYTDYSSDPVQPRLTWESWNGAEWQAISASTTVGGPGITDGTSAFTRSGNVTVNFSTNPKANVVNGVEGYWLRAKLSGSYGPGASLKPVYDKSTPPVIVNYDSRPAAAPLITSLSVTYKTEISDQPPDLVLTCNDFAYEKISRESLASKSPFTPFKSSQWTWKGAWNSTADYLEGDVVKDGDSTWIAKRDNKNEVLVEGDSWTAVAPPAFYLGFELPPDMSAFPGSKISIYVGASGEKNSLDRTQVEWEYSAGAQGAKWGRLMVRDGTEDFTQPGLIEFLAPPDFEPRVEFGLARYWLRAVLESGRYTPGVSALLLNTVMGSRVTSVVNEVLGSSDGGKNRIFRTALAPVLEGERLEVREPDLPSPDEQKVIIRENAEGAISITRDEAGHPAEVWVRWREAPDFYGSGPRDRHYTIDHLSGEVRFGDGSSGMIPPGNVRMASYKTGGGAGGNRLAGSITELKTTVPYVDKVINYIAASGGAEAETYDSLLHRMPRAIRHGGRAVTFEDYEDLAMLASPETARVKCEQVTHVEQPNKFVFDRLKLIVVPHSTSAQPEPSLELRRRVLEFIAARKSPMVDVEVVKPSYVDVTVTVTICPASLEIANDLRLIVTGQLTSFLHPLAGGFDGTGWDFGRQPHLSDLYYLIEMIPGVDHVITLRMTPDDDAPFTQDNFLISSGKHVVACEFEGA